MSHQAVAERAGFTIVEQLVAIIVLGVGLLAVAHGVVGLQRHARRAELALDATAATSSSIDRVSMMACESASGTDSVRRVQVRWSASGAGPVGTLAARGQVDVNGALIGDSLTSARNCQPGS